MTREPGRADREAAARAHEVAQRAIRRLDMLESVMIAGGAVLALLAGALISWLLVGAGGVGFRRTWIVTSLILFVVPGVIAIFKIRKDRRELAHRAARRQETTRPEEGKRD